MHASLSIPRLVVRLLTATALVAGLGAVSKGTALHLAGSHGSAVTSAYAAGTGCQLASPSGAVQHVIYIQFDNTHFTRDNPNVPSDLEQMPHLLNFIKGNGTLLSNHHTPLISHTATDILTSLTGVYGDRHGVPVSNSFRYFNPDGTTNTGVAFAYWTAPLFDPTTTTGTDTQYNMLTSSSFNMPAPWVPYTRAGCNVGSVATANTILENTAIDIPTVFGASSDQAAEVKSNPDQAFADFVGIGIHCAKGDALCSTANGGQPDVLPQEPGGYSGYTGLFGHKYVAPQISPSGPLTDLNGTTIADAKGHVGFPGFDGMSAAVSLGYVAAMQEHGVPVTYAYISDAHDNHSGAGAYGPGQAGYVAALKSYDDAFAKFFTRLQADGINQSNTLFVFTSDENDHFVGGPPTPANCDGVTVPCTYSKIGEFNANLTGLLATQQGITTPFKVHADDAPTIYITGNPPPGAAVTRQFERALGKLTGTNQITGATEPITRFLADPVEEKLLHMVTADPARTPNVTLFADPNYFLATGKPDCSTPCITEPPAFAWNHGDVQSDIVTTWLGMVGPGVKNMGVDPTTWSDHTDIRPTIMALTGLKDDYAHDGRVLFEDLTDNVAPSALSSHVDTLLRLGQTYKQINASVGQLAQSSLVVSTAALMSNSQDDNTYQRLEGKLWALMSDRNSLAGQMEGLLEGATFFNQRWDEQYAQRLIAMGQALLNRASAMAAPYQ